MKNLKNVEQQVNHRNSWEETQYSSENKNHGDINSVIAIHFLILFFQIYCKGLTLYLFQESSIPLDLEKEY